MGLYQWFPCLFFPLSEKLSLMDSDVEKYVQQMKRGLYCLKQGWKLRTQLGQPPFIVLSSLLLHFPKHPQTTWSMTHLLGLIGLL